MVFAFSGLSALHAILHKRDARAALGWVGLCLMAPWVGGFLYWLLGVNRIQTHAKELWNHLKEEKAGVAREYPAKALVPPVWEPLNQISTRVTRRPLLPGNQIYLLRDGEQAYPAMLSAIDAAKESIYLSTYIFDWDATGRLFVEALARAKRRGARIRVLVDAFGAQYSFPQIFKPLRAAGVPFSKFLPFSLSPGRFHPNLRDHRKILLVDGQRAFTGGMNISGRHLTQKPSNRRPVSDLHFELRGPIIQELTDVFLEDWYFSSGESIAPDPPPAAGAGKLLARVVSSGPNEDFEKLNWILLGALSAARQRVQIITPYFVPDRVIIAALNAASLKGVLIEIILPEKNNLPFVGWAGRALLWEMLEKGVRFYEQAPPFAHTKLMVVDGLYSLIGSSNWDARSFRLNFELDVEAYSEELGSDLEGYFNEARSRSEEITLKSVQEAPFGIRFRNSFFNLFSPYL
jgi:cardiolipin synthase